MISVTILTKNSARLIADVLDSVSWCQEVIVMDTGSTDPTIEISRTYPNVKLHQVPFSSFGQLHNQMAELASFDWIFSLDSDEVMSKELSEELQELSLDPKTVYSVARQNFFNGKWIRRCGWWPDRAIRLYHRRQTKFSADRVHERVIRGSLKEHHLHHPLHHYSYTCIGDFLTKMQHYTELYAQQHRHIKKSSLWTAMGHSWTTFLRCYLLRLGFLDGYEGYLISRYNADTAFYKYLKLKELNEDKPPTIEPHPDSTA